ncbi:MAG: carbohydrate ABC transporter permease [Clostridiales bacterium]|nr:carbohydrate ABC transporter permease [Clostridiales bacterium]
MAIKEPRGDRIFGAVVFVIVTLLMLIVLYPLVYVLSCSVSSPTAVGAGEVVLLPKGFTLMGYRRVFQEPDILLGYKNTLFYTIIGTAINLFVTVPAGYMLSKKEVPGRNLFMFLFMFTMYFSGGMIPSFLLVKSLHLYDTRAVLVILGAFSTYNCIICRTFFAALPHELEEAAAIDGCSTVRTFIQIVLPLSQALLGVMVLYFAVGHWNSYFNAMIYVNNEKYKPLQLILRRILILEQASANMMEGGGDEYAAEQFKLKELIKYAVIVVSSLPVLVLYPFLQKYFVQGVMIGSIKG